MNKVNHKDSNLQYLVSAAHTFIYWIYRKYNLEVLEENTRTGSKILNRYREITWKIDAKDLNPGKVTDLQTRTIINIPRSLFLSQKKSKTEHFLFCLHKKRVVKIRFDERICF